MLHLQLFTDASVNAQRKVGYGAYLVVLEQAEPLDALKNKVKLKRFEQTSSTKLELQTLLWAVNEISVLSKEQDFCLTVYTDSQNIISLPTRRARLERDNYRSSKNKQLNNAELYQEFFQLFNNPQFRLVKVIAHKASSQKSEIDRRFALVDKASRQALRDEY